jgi:hypothetical protein
VPKQTSTGGKERLGSISKAGNRYLRSLLVVGALSVIRRAKQVGYTRRPWLAELMARRPVKVAAIALANKIARIAWALMVSGIKGSHRQHAVLRRSKDAVPIGGKSRLLLLRSRRTRFRRQASQNGLGLAVMEASVTTPRWQGARIRM